MGIPPSDFGAAHDTVTCWKPATAVTGLGTPGTVGARGVMAADGPLAGPFPDAFTAATVNVYAVPSVRPPTRKLVTAAVRTVAPPGDAVITYAVTGDPPSEDGGVQDTRAPRSRAAAATPVGAPGFPVAADTCGAPASSPTDTTAASTAARTGHLARPCICHPPGNGRTGRKGSDANRSEPVKCTNRHTGRQGWGHAMHPAGNCATAGLG